MEKFSSMDDVIDDLKAQLESSNVTQERLRQAAESLSPEVVSFALGAFGFRVFEVTMERSGKTTTRRIPPNEGKK